MELWWALPSFHHFVPPTEPSSSRPAGTVEEGEAIAKPSRIKEKISSVDSDEVESVVRALMFDEDSTTIEAEEDEDPPEIIPEKDDEDGLADLYMPPLLKLTMAG